MELPATYSEKFTATAASKNQPALIPGSAWEAELDKFAAILNENCATSGFAPMTHPRIAKLLSKAGVHDADQAYRFYQRCSTGRSFAGLFNSLTGNRAKTTPV